MREDTIRATVGERAQSEPSAEQRPRIVVTVERDRAGRDRVSQAHPSQPDGRQCAEVGIDGELHIEALVGEAQIDAGGSSRSQNDRRGAAEGFSSKVLIEKPRTLSTSTGGYVWIVPGATSDGTGVSATISDKESFTASYRLPTERRANADKAVAYATPDLPPMAVGKYIEGLRLVTVQPGGRSAAHMHSGFEGVLVLEGRVLIRSGGSVPTYLTAGQGFYILPKVPIQLINAGDAIARTLVYSISPEGATFSTELPQSP